MGHHDKHFGGDRYALDGYWAPSTSAANFCEEDYAMTLYIAEFINTFSNLAYVYFAVHQWRSRPKSTGHQKFDPMASTLFLVGITSFLFHATLRQAAQLSDDLSMLVLATSIIHRLYTSGKPAGYSTTFTIVLVSTVTALSAYYVSTQDIFFHFCTFAGLLMLIWPRTVYLIYYRQRSQQQKSQLLKRFGKAIVVLVVGFAIWNVDLEMCFQLRGWRGEIGLPWAWLLECHGWWHVLTAVGASEYMWLTRELCE